MPVIRVPAVAVKRYIFDTLKIVCGIEMHDSLHLQWYYVQLVLKVAGWLAPSIVPYEALCSEIVEFLAVT